jgi:NAD(P)-dependent dehydrogenase (short-subunit alcohol dehydrogenase family)
MPNLAGRRTIITGGARGIGLACARRFSAEGAAVLVVDLDVQAGEAVVAELMGQGANAAFHAADLSQPAAIPGVIAAAVQALGGVDILVNNAGIAPMAEFFELSAAAFDQVMAINLRAPFLLTQAAARRMRDQGTGGAVVNLSSINAVLNGPTSLAYCVSKGGLNQLTRNCAIALAPFGVRVNAVGPGTIATELATQAGLTGDGVRPVLERTPMGRLGDADEIAAVAVFLASEDASFVSGQTVYADGGRLGLNYSLPIATEG